MKQQIKLIAYQISKTNLANNTPTKNTKDTLGKGKKKKKRKEKEKERSNTRRKSITENPIRTHRKPAKIFNDSLNISSK